jgi:hypothetical protein
MALHLFGPVDIPVALMVSPSNKVPMVMAAYP